MLGSSNWVAWDSTLPSQSPTTPYGLGPWNVVPQTIAPGTIGLYVKITIQGGYEHLAGPYNLVIEADCNAAVSLSTIPATHTFVQGSGSSITVFTGASYYTNAYPVACNVGCWVYKSDNTALATTLSL